MHFSSFLQGPSVTKNFPRPERLPLMKPNRHNFILNRTKLLIWALKFESICISNIKNRPYSLK